MAIASVLILAGTSNGRGNAGILGFVLPAIIIVALTIAFQVLRRRKG